VSSEGFLLRFFLGLAGSLAAVALTVGCAVHQRSTEGRVLGAGVEDGSWASPAEIAWLGKLGAWDSRLLRGLQTAARVESTPGLADKLMHRDGRTMVMHARALEPAGSCDSDLTTKVGSAPTVRLERAYDTFRTACAHLQRFHNAIRLAVSQRQASTIDEAQQEAKRAGAVLLQADQMLPPGEVRALPVIAGKTEQSRIEPRRRIEPAGGQADEVRCWSTATGLMMRKGSYTHGKPGPRSALRASWQPRESRSHCAAASSILATTTPNRWTCC
jgi:hypothetical protein